MNSKISIIVLVCLAVCLANQTSLAQPKPVQRTEEFEKLNVFVGKWQFMGKIYPSGGMPIIETKGEPTFKWVMRKTWLMNVTGEGRMQGHGYMTWDKELSEYMFFWFDNFVTKPLEYRGNWLDSQTLVVNREKLSAETTTAYRITWRFI